MIVFITVHSLLTLEIKGITSAKGVKILIYFQKTRQSAMKTLAKFIIKKRRCVTSVKFLKKKMVIRCSLSRI